MNNKLLKQYTFLQQYGFTCVGSLTNGTFNASLKLSEKVGQLIYNLGTLEVKQYFNTLSYVKFIPNANVRMSFITLDRIVTEMKRVQDALDFIECN